MLPFLVIFGLIGLGLGSYVAWAKANISKAEKQIKTEEPTKAEMPQDLYNIIATLDDGSVAIEEYDVSDYSEGDRLSAVEHRAGLIAIGNRPIKDSRRGLFVPSHRIKFVKVEKVSND